jgi:uncharacterized phage infection (PIP) family protein YhgE
MAPATGGAVAPATSGGSSNGGAVTPATRGGAVAPTMPNLPAPAGVPTNLSAFSILDLIRAEMNELNTQLTHLGEALVPMAQTADSIDAVVTNLDELSKIYEAPAATRSATDAASAVGAHMADMCMAVQDHALQAQILNAQAFIALQAMLVVQDNQRAQGAGPRLLASAGR